MTVQHMTQETDADAVYINNKFAESLRLDDEAQSKTEAATAMRKEAGKRLNEVAERGVKEKGFSFTTWVEAHCSFTRQTAYNLRREAGWSEEQREDHKAKERDRKNKANAKKRATTSIVGNALGKQIGGTQKTKMKAAGIDVDAKLEEGSAAAEEVIEKAAAVLNTTIVTREDLSMSAQQKYDRALAKALDDQKAAQEKAYWKDVNAKALEVMPDRIQRIEKANKEALRDLAIMRGRGFSISLNEYRKLSSLLHCTTGEPKTLTVEQLNDGFNIVRKLDGLIKAYADKISL